MQKGGILIISKDEANIYNKLQIALTQGKPVLWYETSTECYYIDTISGGEITTEIVDDEEVITYGDIILTKGGKTITITSANAVTESGNIQAHLYALTFNISDTYLTFIVRKSSGLNGILMNSNEDTTCTMTENQIKALYDSLDTALTDGNGYLLNSIVSDTESGYVSYSDTSSIVLNDSSNTYDFEFSVTESSIGIINCSNQVISIYEKQLF